MADMGVNVPVIISTTKVGTGAQDVAADIRAVGGAAAQAAQQASAGAAAQAAAVAQVGAAAERAATFAERQAQREAALAALGAAAAKASGAAAQATTSQALALLALKVRAVDVANQAELDGTRAAILAHREQLDTMGAEEEQYLKLGLVTQALENRVEALAKAEAAAAAAAARMGNTINGVNPQRLMRTASAVNQIEFAVEGANASSLGLARSLGQVAQTVGMMSNGASWALMATGIGAAVVVAAGLAEALHKANEEAKASPIFDEQLGMMRVKDAAGHFKAATLTAYRDTLIKKADTERENYIALTQGIHAFDDLAPFGATSATQPAHEARQAYERTLDEISKVQKKISVDAHDEVQSTRDLAFHRALEAESLERSQRITIAKLGYDARAAQLAADEAPYRQQKEEQLQMEALGRRAEIERSFQRFDEYGRELALNDTLISQKAKELQLADAIADAKRRELAHAIALANAAYAHQTAASGADNRSETYQAQAQLIKDQQQADERAGISKEEAEARAQQKIRKLREDTLKGSIGDLKTLEQATINSHNAQIRAVGTAANAMRRLAIGALAAKSAVEGAEQLALIPASLAVGDGIGAALHAAAGVQLEAAAAMGFREALGGGGSSGGGGGGGGGGAGQTTFTPNAPQGAGQQNIYLITRDPYGRDAIQRVAYELDRSGKLNRPIPISPTTGLAPFAG